MRTSVVVIYNCNDRIDRYLSIYVYGGGSSVWNTLLSHSTDCVLLFLASVALPSLTPVPERTNSVYPSPPQPAPAPLALRCESELQVTQHCTLHLYCLLPISDRCSCSSRTPTGFKMAVFWYLPGCGVRNY